MKKTSLLLLLASLAVSATAQTPAPDYSEQGQMILVKLDSAPFPHPARADGHKYNNEFYPADKNYSDNTVGIFVPKGFKPTGGVDFVVHFHGWRNHVVNVFSHYQLVQQLMESGRNAILVVPQGPYDAPDSFDGKLEDADGFKKLMQDVMATLRGKKVIHDEPLGSIILSGHSGGYEVISSIVTVGGLTDHIREAWLFDALYGRTEKFMTWFDHHPGVRLINIYTDHGGTKAETEKLIADLKQKSAPYLSRNETEIISDDLQKKHLIFIHTELEHDETPWKHHTFAEYLKTSCLPPIKAQ